MKDLDLDTYSFCLIENSAFIIPTHGEKFKDVTPLFITNNWRWTASNLLYKL